MATVFTDVFLNIYRHKMFNSRVRADLATRTVPDLQ